MTPVPQQTNTVWPLAVLGAGLITTVAVLGVGWWVSSSWTIWNGLIGAAVLMGPYLLCALGLWLARGPYTSPFTVRIMAVAVILCGVPGLTLAVYEADRFTETGNPVGILGHGCVAVAMLLPQYLIAASAAILTWLVRGNGASARKEF